MLMGEETKTEMVNMEEAQQKESDIKVSLQNLGTVNKNLVEIEKEGKRVRLYFSHQTLVAVDGMVSVNDWSMTTGKLLNKLCPDKKARVSHAEVLQEAQKRLKEVLA